MARNIDLALVRAFVAVAETGSMTAAGRLLNLTQAAVSQQIKRLEDGFGQPLFEREPKRLRLSPAGERLHAQGQRLLALNDEIWSLMTAPEFEGEVRLGVPHDIIAALMPPVLRSFDQAWPRVRVSIVSRTSTQLLGQLAAGAIDLTLTTEETTPSGARLLFRDPLVWVGVTGGKAHIRRPLPLSLGDPSCQFRGAALEALAGIGRDWRSVCEVGEMEPLLATVRADLAVMALLESTVPDGLQILGAEVGLPPLPSFAVNLYLPAAGASDIAVELAEHIGTQVAARLARVA